jgi:Ca2+ transporting ATPase
MIQDGGGGFKFTTAQLIQLIETPKEHVEKELEKLGGVEGVAAGLGVSLTVGLDSNRTDDLNRREATFGKNYVAPPRAAGILELMFEALQDPTLLVLMASGLMSLILGVTVAHDPNEWIEGASILGAVLLVTSVSAINDYQKEKQFAALNAVKEDEKIKVIRNGFPAEVSKFKLLVGDIVRVDLGDIMPADGLVFDESDLKIDESAMTGESDLMKKTRKETPIIFSGTRVMEGLGKMLVVCVGCNSQAGIISALIAGKQNNEEKKDKKKNKDEVKPVDTMKVIEVKKKQENSQTQEKREQAEVYEDHQESPLQGKLNKLTVMIGKFGTFMAVMVLFVMTIKFSIMTFVVDDKTWDKSYFNYYLKFFITSVTVLVVAIPEGLPLAVTISLAYSVKKMLLENNLVRHLDACETMGSATTICSDKTGTLTTNRMTVMQCWIGGQEVSSAAELQGQISDKTKDALVHSVCLNSTAEILPPKVPGQPFEHTGNKTECALLTFTQGLGVNYSDVRKANTIGHMLTFSSKKKRMSVIAKRDSRTSRVFCKGATEVVLGLCSKIKRLDGSVTALTEHDKEQIGLNVIEKYAKQGYRTLCLAFRDLDVSTEDASTWSDDEIERDLTCVCIVGIEDPVRPEVPESIRQCHRAGIVVRMVTGDNITTARSIAGKCGILKEGDDAIVMEGMSID